MVFFAIIVAFLFDYTFVLRGWSGFVLLHGNPPEKMEYANPELAAGDEPFYYRVRRARQHLSLIGDSYTELFTESIKKAPNGDFLFSKNSAILIEIFKHFMNSHYFIKDWLNIMFLTENLIDSIVKIEGSKD
ncbi:hypothetical protein, partial [Dickeya dianthicola]|uniref:hypothetical protein n=1 Tax=Dickeya dianthicola TaxID=204039 RepID=UPI0005578801